MAQPSDVVTSSGSALRQSLLVEMPIGLGVSQGVVERVDGDGDDDGVVVVDVVGAANVGTVVGVNFGMMEKVKMVPESASPVVVVATMVMVGMVVWMVAGAIPIYVIMAMVVAVVLVVGAVVVGVMVGLGHVQCKGILVWVSEFLD
ncbi:hypothetical protein KC19_2G174100 [Ceratodon purpureus]|uniref:Transmembrane protein n=1 Tax=Ceratodon purpureus TaxID=3225 RepID=A0A8T0IWN9_CERPU|nr:hypothetical protein KC19_2G174100 [Ceratodon purpureus]